MAQTVIMPKLGQTVEESTIVRWHKAEGDQVKKGDVLFEIETDKAVLEAPSFFDGTLLKVLVPEGRAVPVRSVVAFIGQPGEKLPDVPVSAPVAGTAPAAGAARAAVAAKPAAAAAPATPRAPAAAAAAPAAPSAPPSPGRTPVSPRARRLAREKAIDVSRATGSGPGGRVTERDVLAWLEESGYNRLRISPAALELARREEVDVLDLFGSGELGRIARADVEEAVAARPAPISRMRQVIAERLAHSFATAPHFYVTVAADITGLSALREELKAAGRRYTVNDFILKSVAEALREFPNVNSVCDGRTACRRSRVHLGVAVALDSGLVVPVIRDADRQGLAELRDAAVSQVARAREGRLGPDDMRGGTFTVSNMGMLDVENFAAIINPGETAILAVASARPSPAVVEGRLAVRTLMKMTLSADHRMVDGAEGARFVNAVRARLEDVDKWKSMT